MRKKLFLLICMMAFALFSASMAVASSSYTNDFNSEYGTDGTRGGDTLGSCITCHTGPTGPIRNSYGRDYADGGYSFTAIENIDSDGDGFNNIEEILVGTFPGDPDSTSVANALPLANAGGPYNGTVNEPLQFNGNGSSDPDGSIVAFDWDFGDGSSGTGATPSHTYAGDGSFTVTLTVTDDSGDTGTGTTTATIGLGNQAPVANANGPYNGTVSVPVQFDSSGSSDPDGSIVAYDWDFGDGSTGSSATPSHSYAADGTYNVTLTVTDDQGSEDSAMTTATIGPGNRAPIADTYSSYSGTVNELIQFDGTGSLDPDGTIVAYDWDFGDGSSGNGSTPAHSYAADGIYNVTLTVTDDAGATGSDTTTATIGPGNQAPVADTDSTYNGTVNEPIQFDGTGSSDPDGSIVAYDWDFGDGGTGTGPAPVHAYIADGTYTVTLTVTDDLGAQDSAITTATIGQGNQAPVAEANGPYNGVVNEPIQFNGTGSSDPDGSIVAYAWDFGDGGSGTDATPTHAFAADGTYNVTLTVTDDMGASDSITTTVTILPDAQPPVISPSPETGEVEVEEYVEDEVDDDDDEYESEHEERSKSYDRKRRYDRKRSFKHERKNDRDDD